jgi:hypothetical protein
MDSESNRSAQRSEDIMNATAVETIPTEWIDERDVPFFRITTSVFGSDFVFGATVLLASYDSAEASNGLLDLSDSASLPAQAAMLHPAASSR